jgi:hypothetical protein
MIELGMLTLNLLQDPKPGRPRQTGQNATLDELERLTANLRRELCQRMG